MENQLLDQAVRTIEHLRDRNRMLEAQVGVIEVFAAALGLRQNTGGGMAPDLVWEIKQYLAQQASASKAGNATAPQ